MSDYIIIDKKIIENRIEHLESICFSDTDKDLVKTSLQELGWVLEQSTPMNCVNPIVPENIVEMLKKHSYDMSDFSIHSIVDWFDQKHNINIEVPYFPNIGKYRWVAKPKRIIPRNIKTAKDYDDFSQYYKSPNFDKRNDAYLAAFQFIYENQNLYDL